MFFYRLCLCARSHFGFQPVCFDINCFYFSLIFAQIQLNGIPIKITVFFVTSSNNLFRIPTPLQVKEKRLIQGKLPIPATRKTLPSIERKGRVLKAIMKTNNFRLVVE